MIIIIMGVSGVGKTTIGSLLARELGFRFVDADTYHTKKNVEKMQRGIPLNDTDREPWLVALSKAVGEWNEKKENVVLACSALKEKYRNTILGNSTNARWIYLSAPVETISKRLEERNGHFMPKELLQSQFEILEEPGYAIKIDADAEPEDIVKKIRSLFDL